MIKEFENIRKYKKKIRIKFIDFKMLIDSFHRFFSKKSINENVNNSKSKRSFSNFNNDLIKTFKKIFRGFFNDFNKISFFKNSLKKNIITQIAFRR